MEQIQTFFMIFAAQKINMKYILSLFLVAVLLIGCEKKSENAMHVSGTIDGLKKGTLFLQHIKDSSLTTIDSVVIKGNGDFKFEHDIESPEVFYLYLEKADNNDINDRIIFFGEKGDITINTAWNTFDSKAEITGSKSQETFQECRDILSRFNTKDLEYVQAMIRQENPLDSLQLDSVQKLANKNSLRRYLYVLNFALTNPDSPVSPYMALTEASDANPKYLDSISKALSPEVANSKYGKTLKAYLAKTN